MEKIIIMGGGAAGMTAALYASRANLNPLLIAGPLPGGLLTQTTDVENFPGFPDAVNGYELMYRFQLQAEKFGTRTESAIVQSLELTDGGPHKLTLDDGRILECQALIIATGASPRYLGLDSEKRFLNKGVSACATCDGAFYRNVPVAVVGGGDSAMEEANFLTHFASEVHLLHRRDTFRASSIMVKRAQENPKIHFHINSVVQEICGEKEVESVQIKNTVTGELSSIACKGYFAALGHIPNTALFQGVLELDEAGYLVLQGGTSLTSMAGVFGAGDCADPRYRQAIHAAGMGCAAAMDAERFLNR